MAKTIGIVVVAALAASAPADAPGVAMSTRDEGRPFEVGNQVLISSHRKLLLSKAMVVNVAEKSERDFGRYD
jgi:hypothetical protein